MARVVMLLHKSVAHDSRVRRAAGALVGAGHSVCVLELAPVDVAVPDGFARRSVLPRPRLRRLPLSLHRIVFAGTFVRGVVRLRPDVVHAHDAAMLLPGLLGARLSGARLVYDAHEFATGVPYRGRVWTWLVAAIERFGARRADAVVTVSDGIADRLQAKYSLAERPVVVRNVCDAAATAGNGRGARDAAGPVTNICDATAAAGNGRAAAELPAGDGLRARAGIGADAPLVLHQGAAAPRRGCETLVRALAAVPGAELVFLGDGDPGTVARLEAVAADAGVADRVHQLPSVALEDLLSATGEADLGATLLEDTCENHRLALPNKVFEYVAAGVPVVASDLPELRRLVTEHGIGFLARPGDPESVARAVREALAARTDTDLQARVATAATVLTWDREKAGLLVVYERLAA